MALFDYDTPDVDEDARREDIDARRRRARLAHYCSDCLGFTGAGSPCEPEYEEDDDA